MDIYARNDTISVSDISIHAAGIDRERAELVKQLTKYKLRVREDADKVKQLEAVVGETKASLQALRNLVLRSMDDLYKQKC